MRYRERDIWAGLAVLASVSLLLLFYADYRENRTRLAEFQQRQMAALGESAGSFHDFIRRATQNLVFLSQMPEVRGLDVAAARERLESYLPFSHERGLLSLFLADEKGRLLLHVAGRPLDDVVSLVPDRLDGAELDWASRPASANTVRTRWLGNGPSALTLELLTPVYLSSPSVRLRGVLGATVDLEAVARRNLSGQALTPASESVLAFARRVMASEPPNLAGRSLEEIVSPPAASLLSPAAQERQEPSVFMDWKGGGRGEPSVVAWWPLQMGEERWLLVAVTPRSAITRRAGERLVHFLPWLFFAGGLTVASVGLVKMQRQQLVLLRKVAGEQERSKGVAELAWQNALMAQIVDEIRHTLEPAVIARIAVEHAGRVLRAWRSAIYLPDADGTCRVEAESAPEGASPLAARVLPPPLMPASPLSVEDLTDSSDPSVRGFAREVGARSCLLAPVPLRHGMSGVLALYHDRPRAWKVREAQCAERIASQAGTALEQAALYGEQVRAAEVRGVLLKVGPALSSARDRAAVMKLAAAEAARLTGSRRTWILVADAEGEPLRVGAWGGAAPAVVVDTSSLSFRPGEHAYLEEAIRTRSPVVIQRANRDGRVPPADVRNLGLESMVLAMPLLYGPSLLGVFLFERLDAGRGVGQTEMEVARAIAELTSAALMNAQLFEALSASEARYEDLYDNAPDMYQTLDCQGVILDCNQTESRLLGFEKSDMVGRPFKDFLTTESSGAWDEILGRIFEQGFLQDVSLKLRRKDGKMLEVSLNASAIRGTGTGCEAARVVLRDVTQLKELEHQLRQSQKLEVVGTLAGGLAHDFNNILGGILGYASLLRAEFQGSPSAQKYLETIERSATRGSELTAKLLAASRRGPIRSEPVDLNQVVEETVEILERTLHKTVRIEKKLDPRLRLLLGDRSQLQQVVLNLCVNARDAMPGGGRLGIETELLEKEGLVRISVEDDGVGMEGPILDRIFEPFFSTKGEAGTGLGLAVVYGIVKASEGDVKVTSAPGQGARFDIFLPARWAEERAGKAERRETIKGQGQLVLMVDDEEVLRDLGREILQRSGYRVEVASGGLDAIEIFRARAGEVSLVIVDLLMPGMGGAETCEKLRALDPTVPILLSSGFSQEGTIEKLLREGPGGFLPKPYTMADLTRAVAHVLGQGNKPPRRAE